MKKCSLLILALLCTSCSAITVTGADTDKPKIHIETGMKYCKVRLRAKHQLFICKIKY